jgi:hypothetical protein
MGMPSFCDPTDPSVCDGVVSASPTLAVPGTGVVTANATQGWVPAGTRHHLLTRPVRDERPAIALNPGATKTSPAPAAFAVEADHALGR